jgi:hypothetical protein
MDAGACRPRSRSGFSELEFRLNFSLASLLFLGLA